MTDYRSEANRAQRLQMMAKLLAGQTVQPQGQMVSGRYVAPSWAQSLAATGAQLGSAYALRKSDEADTSSRGLRTKAVAEALAEYGQRPDQFTAWTEAAGSDLPEVAKVGQDRLKFIQDTLKDKGDNRSMIAAALTGDLGGVTAKRDLLEVNGQVLDKEDPNLGLVKDARTKWTPAGVIAGVPVQRADTGEIDQIVPRVPVTNVNVGDGLTKTLAPRVWDAAEGARTKKIQAQSMLDTTARMAKLLQDPKVITGALQGPRAMLANVGELIFPGDAQALEKTQNLVREASNLSLDSAVRMEKQGQITQPERELLQAAAGGNLDWTRETLQQVLEVTQKVALWQQANADQLLNNIKNDPDFSRVYDLLNTEGMPSQNDMQAPNPAGVRPDATTWDGGD